MEPMTETATTTEAEKTAEGEQKQQEQTFTQADLDRYAAKVRAEERRKVTERFADYDDVKAKAEGAKTLEERFGALESELATSKAQALRARIAADYGISTKPSKEGEPSDADLFLTGSDEASLTAQAQRLAGREADRKKQGNVAPKEGETKTSGGTDAELREFASGLFRRTD